MTYLTEQQNTTHTERDDLSASVLLRIDKECVVPSPRWQFLAVEYGIWVLWGLSVLFGAVAFSVLIFFLTHAGFAVYEATHDSVFELFIDVLPLMWVGVFALMAVLAHFNLRHTKCGYRYTVLRVLLSSIVFSFIGGLLLHVLGIGFLVDDFMSRRMSLFGSLEQIETRLWQNPVEGRMIGTYEGSSPLNNDALFTDAKGAVWHLNIAELNAQDVLTLEGGGRVHVIGIASSTTPFSFHSCAVFPWMLKKPASLTEMRAERTHFLGRMKEHHKNMFDELIASSTLNRLQNRAICGSHKAVQRINKRFAQ